MSNIRDAGLPCAEAASVIAELIVESAKRQLSGVGLKLSAPRAVSA
ncbi:MAG: ethanolamine ammonia-lyase light chain EutC [Gammaproteobacteria bacterium]